MDQLPFNLQPSRKNSNPFISTKQSCGTYRICLCDVTNTKWTVILTPYLCVHPFRCQTLYVTSHSRFSHSSTSPLCQQEAQLHLTPINLSRLRDLWSTKQLRQHLQKTQDFLILFPKHAKPLEQKGKHTHTIQHVLSSLNENNLHKSKKDFAWKKNCNIWSIVPVADNTQIIVKKIPSENINIGQKNH